MTVTEFHQDLEQLRDTHHKLLSNLQDITARMKKNEFEIKGLADISFICKEMAELLDDFRKDYAARKIHALKLLAHKLLTDPENLNNAEAVDIVRGNYASVTVDIKKFAELPQYGTDEFCKLMDFLGVPEESYNSGLIKFNWAALKRKVTQCLENGTKLPPGLGKLHTEIVGRFTKYKG